MRSRSARTLSSLLAVAGVGQCQCDRGVTGEVTDEVKVAVIKRGLALIACHRDDTEHRPIGAQRHDDRGALADIGERLNRMPEILSDQRGARSEHLAACRAIDGNPLTQYVLGVHSDRGVHDEGVDFVIGHMVVGGNENDRLLCLGQLLGAFGNELHGRHVLVDCRQAGQR